MYFINYSDPYGMLQFKKFVLEALSVIQMSSRKFKQTAHLKKRFQM